MANHHYIRIPKNTGMGYVPSYSEGFVTAGSVFFHKSGQIWELLGFPKGHKEIRAEILNPTKDFYVHRVGNFAQREKDLSFPGAMILEFGQRGKVTVTMRDSKNPPIRLKWRRCSLAEIRLREVMEAF